MTSFARFAAAAGIAALAVTATPTAALAGPPYISRADAELQQEIADPPYYGPGESAVTKVVCLKSDWPWRQIRHFCYKVPR